MTTPEFESNGVEIEMQDKPETLDSIIEQEYPELEIQDLNDRWTTGRVRRYILSHPKKIALVGAVVVLAVLALLGAMTIGIIIGATTGGNGGNGGNGGDGGDDGTKPFHYDSKLEPVLGDPYPLDRSKKLMKDLEETKEFQVRLVASEYANRMKGVEAFLDVLRQYSGLPFSDKDAMESVRVEYQITGTPCGKSQTYDEIRLRDYVTGWNVNHTTLDIKYSSRHTTKEMAANVDILPSAPYYNTSWQKIEQDVHKCFNKYSRKTMVKQIPFKYRIDSCEDILSFYPDAWTDFTPRSDGQPTIVSTGSASYWWLYSHEGYFTNGVKFLSSFTLIYSSMKDAVEGKVAPSRSSEWSLRIWSTKDGKGPWDAKKTWDVVELYENLLAHVGVGAGDEGCKTFTPSRAMAMQGGEDEELYQRYMQVRQDDLTNM